MFIKKSVLQTDFWKNAWNEFSNEPLGNYYIKIAENSARVRECKVCVD